MEPGNQNPRRWGMWTRVPWQGFFVPGSGQAQMGMYFSLLTLAAFTGMGAAAIWVGHSPEWLGCIWNKQVCSTTYLTDPTFDLRRVGVSLVSMTLFACGSAFLLGVLISHAVFGPKKRILNHLDALLSGNYSSRLVLRKTDSLKDIADRLNALAVKLEQGRTSESESGPGRDQP